MATAQEFKSRTIRKLKNRKRYPEFSTIHSFCNRILHRFYKNYEEQYQAYYKGSELAMVSCNFDYTFLHRNYFKGSCPCPPHGLQLAILFKAKRVPLMAPYFLTA